MCHPYYSLQATPHKQSQDGLFYKNVGNRTLKEKEREIASKLKISDFEYLLLHVLFCIWCCNDGRTLGLGV